MKVGLNPYGLTYTLGLQGRGTPRANPAPGGLAEFIAIARRVGARTIEIDWRWLLDTPDARLAEMGADFAGSGMAVVISTWLQHEPGETIAGARRAARLMRASLVRMHLLPVLEGARAVLGPEFDTRLDHARNVLVQEAEAAREEGLQIGIENHQDLGSEELLALADEAGDNVGIVFDTGNAFALGEDPVAFARRVAHRLTHLHLKDYRAQMTSEGFRLIRCAVGDGCVPFDEIMSVLGGTPPERPLTASLEIAALEARHIRLFTAGWWQRYPPRDARELGVALGRLRARRLREDEDVRTPWERDAEPAAIVAYEEGQLERSVAFAREMGWM